MTDGKGKARLINTPALVVVLIVLILMPVASFAQITDPCAGTDPYTTCPLDTNVWVLVAIALIAGATYLYRQQKMQHTKA
jgi:cation transporter-like permease